MSREGATHAASDRRRRQAREDGHFVRSREIVLLLLIAVTLLMCAWLGPATLHEFRNVLRESLASAGSVTSGGQMLDGMRDATFRLALRLLPFLAALCGAAIVASWGQTGLVWMPQRIVPDPQRINPMTGLQRLSDRSITATTLLAFAKGVLVAGASTWFVLAEYEAVLALVSVPPNEQLNLAAPIAFRFVAKLLAAYLLYSVIDYCVASLQYEARLRMTDDERRDEVKAVQNDVREFRRR